MAKEKIIDLSKSSMVVLAVVIGFTLVAVYFGFFFEKEQAQGLPPNFFTCNDIVTQFVSNVSDCMAVPITPNAKSLGDLVTNPNIDYLFILIDPEGPPYQATASYDIFKILNSINIRTGVVYTSLAEDYPEVPVMSIEDATLSSPIIWLKYGQNETKIVVEGTTVLVYSTDENSLSAAACRISIAAINETMRCK